MADDLKNLISARRVKQMFKSYGTEIGRLVIFWNRLHESLSRIFALVANPQSPKVGSAIWFSTDNDYQQRKMLRAALPLAIHISDKQREAIIWVLNKIDDRLRHDRNNAIHAPLLLVLRVTVKETSSVIEADEFSENPRALALRGKDLKTEINQYIELTDTLAKHATLMARSLKNPSAHAWPDKPPLPHAHQKKNRKGSSRRSRPKSPPRPRVFEKV